jgi:penicillin-binding protein 1A
MMRETLVSGTARKAEIPGWTAAGKTGTSQDFRDAWFIGYTANLVTGVWLGNDDNSPTRKATGGGLPVEIWTRFMRAAHQGVPVAALPGAQSNGLFPSFAPAQQASMIPAGASNSSTISGGTTSNGAAPATMPQRAPAQPYPAQPAPVPVNSGSTSRPSHGAVRPEAASGLDGWLVERMFGGRR